MLMSPCNYLRTRLPLVSSVLDTVAGLEGVPIIVGGAVRDWIMGRACADIDVEIFNIDSMEHLQFLLKPLGELDVVGSGFGVLRYLSLDGNVDFTMPRLEHKVSDHHTGFDVDLVPGLSFERAASRRDFTVNAIGLDWVTNRIIDPFNGVNDIKAKSLRHVGSQFAEDPLRVLRAMQFAARLKFSIHPDTIKLCRSISLQSLSAARIHQEFVKLFSEAETPSTGILFLEPLGVMDQWRELGHFQQTEAWRLGLEAVDQMGRQLGTKRSFGMMMAAWLYHSQDVAPKAAIANEFLKRLMESKLQRMGLLSLIRTTRKLVLADKEMPSDAMLREASTETQLRHVVTLLAALFPKRPRLYRYVFARATELGILDRRPEPLVTGRDLIQIGIPEGPHLGDLLADFYSAQLAGTITSKSEALRIAEALWFTDDDE